MACPRGEGLSKLPARLRRHGRTVTRAKRNERTWGVAPPGPAPEPALTATAFYDAAEWYDFLHSAETDVELPAVVGLFRALGNGGRRVLEPACGTGRYLAGLGARGYDCLGYDVNARALAFARRRGCRVARGELARFRPTGTFDCVLCLVGTFRHLLSDAAARAHLANTAQALAPGGLYVVGLDLCDYRSPRGDDEVWHVARGRREALHAMTTTAPDARRRAERVHNFIAWRDGRREGTLESTYVLRSYDWPQWESVIAGSGFTLEGWYSQDGARQRRRRPGYWLFALQRN